MKPENPVVQVDLFGLYQIKGEVRIVDLRNKFKIQFDENLYDKDICVLMKYYDKNSFVATYLCNLNKYFERGFNEFVTDIYKEFYNVNLNQIKFHVVNGFLNGHEIVPISITEKKRLFVDMDGTMFEWKSASTYENLFEKGYYEYLEPYQDVVNSINRLCTTLNDINNPFDEIYILSSYLSGSKYAKEEKNKSLDKYTLIGEDNRIFIPDGDIKSDYIPFITKNDYLLDDYTKVNLNKWKEAGGTAIKLINDINNTQGTQHELYIQYNDPLSYLKLADIANNTEYIHIREMGLEM